MRHFLMETEGLGFHEILDIIDAYERRIDWAVREQLDDVLEGDALSRKNPNALRYIREFIAAVSAYMDPDEAEDLIELFTPDA
jgi:hypothetical protein